MDNPEQSSFYSSRKESLENREAEIRRSFRDKSLTQETHLTNCKAFVEVTKERSVEAAHELGALSSHA